MSRTLDDLRKTPPKGRPERSVTICLSPEIIGEIQSLSEELTSLQQRLPASEETGPPRRAAEPDDPRAEQIRTRLAELIDEMAAHEGEMRLRANRTDGEWRRWCNEHAAREEGTPGHDRDIRVTRGICNADDLLDDLAAYAHMWNGEHLSSGDYAAIFEPTVATADKQSMAEAVVAMYESRVDFTRLRTSLSADLRRSNGSDLHGTSGSPTNGSTDGSPASLSEGSTETADPAA